MNIFRCDDCGYFCEEEDLLEKTISLEDYNGVGSMFGDHHFETVGCCPHCGSIEIGEVCDYVLVNEHNKLLEMLREIKRNGSK